MKISIGVPTSAVIHVETHLSIIGILQSSQGHLFHMNYYKGTYIHQMRNGILEEARKAEADYLMFIDSDVVFSADALNKLLASKKDIIGGMYNMKVIPPVNTLKLMDENGKQIANDNFAVPNDIFKCFAIPTGFMLIRLEAIKDLVEPFQFGTDENGGLIGEDVMFCIKAREIGLDVWCDPTINIGHLGLYMY